MLICGPVAGAALGPEAIAAGAMEDGAALAPGAMAAAATAAATNPATAERRRRRRPGRQLPEVLLAVAVVMEHMGPHMF
jgi:hypothetical protein